MALYFLEALIGWLVKSIYNFWHSRNGPHLDRQNVSLRKIWSTFQEKEQNSEADIPDFQVGFFEILEEGKRRMEKDEHDEDNSTRELDDFIAAERSSDTKGENTKYE